MKKFFRNYTYSWKQIAIFKLAMFSVGILIGVLFSNFFTKPIALIIILFSALILSIYIGVVSFKKNK
jgi:uncharacterized protein YacL